MKTPREILIERHRGAEPALDAIRGRAVARAAGRVKSDPRFPGSFIEFLISLRWHAAAISAVWIIVVLLGAGRTDAARDGSEAGLAGPPPMAAILAWRELAEEIDEPGPAPRPEPQPIPHACADPRRIRECNETA